MLLFATPAHAFFSNSPGGGGGIIGGTCTGGQVMGGISSAGVPTCVTPSGGAGYPNGSPAQIGGYAALNTSEAETVSGDFTYARAGANSYVATITKINGITPGGVCGANLYVTTISTSGVPTCSALPAASSVPGGSPPSFVGYSALNTPENETLSGDATLARAGLNSYTIAITKTNGVAFGTLATLNSPLPVVNGGTGSTTALTTGQILVASSATVLAPSTMSGDATIASGGAITVTKTGGVAFTGLATAAIPLSIANGGRGSSTAPTVGQIDVASATTAFTPVTMSADCTITSTGAITCTKLNGVSPGTLFSATTPLSIANGGRGSATAPTAGQIDVAQSGTAFGAVTMSGDATITSAGVVTNTRLNGATPGGTCTGNQYVLSINSSGVPTCGSLLAPIASPTFTGTVTMPDASTITAAGYNSMARLGIGAAAPTGQYYIQVTSANTSAGTYVNITNTATAGAAKIRAANDLGNALSFGSLGSANASAPDEGGPNTQEMFSDQNMSFLVGPTNGITRFVNAATTGTGPLLLTIGGTGGGGGGMTVGAATGGDKGIGTINATNYYVNGTALATTNMTDVTSGAWTPVIQFGGASVGITYSSQTGYYVKVGKEMWAWFSLVTSSIGSSTGAMTITGLPAGSSGSANFTGAASYYAGLTGFTGPPVFIGTGGGTTIQVGTGTPNAWAAAANTNCTATTNISGMVFVTMN